MSSLRGALLGLCLLSGTQGGAAESWPLPPDPLGSRFIRVDSSLGLSQDSVISLAQDHRGYLWLGTQDGLNRWDGREMRVFRADGSEGSIGANWVSALLHDARGVLWIGTTAGLFVHDYRAERFIAADLDLPGDRHVYDLAHGEDGSIWVGSSIGLERWQMDREPHVPPRGELVYSPPVDPRVRAVGPQPPDRVWLAIGDGVTAIDPSSRRPVPTPAPLRSLGEPVNDLLIDSRGRIWLAGDLLGTRVFDPASGILHAPEPLSMARSYVLTETSDGWIWVGAEEFVAALPVDADVGSDMPAFLHRHRTLDPASLGRGRVRTLLATAEDGIWMGTWDGGVSGLHADRSRLLSLTPHTPGSESLRHPSVLNLVEAEGRLWLGTLQGVYSTDASGLHPVLLPGSESISAFAVQVSSERVLVGGDAGIQVFDRQRGSWSVLELAEGLRGSRIRRLRQVDDALWLYAESRGLFVLDAASFAIRHEHLFSAGINHVLPLTDSLVLVSASDGLHWFSRDGAERLHVSMIDPARGQRDALLSGRPSSVVTDANGDLWATLYGSGLARMHWTPDLPPGEARFPLALAPPALANSGVNIALPDTAGRLWLATDRGVSRFDPGSGTVVNFDRTDGALGRGYYYSAGADLAGRLFAAGSKDGYTLFRPGEQPSTRRPRPPLLTAIELDGRPLPIGGGEVAALEQAPDHLQQWSLQPGTGRSVVFRFASPELLQPTHIGYRVKLEGFDPDWQRVEAERGMVAYGNLPPGRFTLLLQALHRGGQGSDITSLDLHVLPYWWQTWPARTAGMLAIMLLVAALYRWRVLHLNRRQVELERRVAERTRAADCARQDAERALQELHTTQDELIRSEKLSALGQLVAGVAHEVNTPLGVVLTASSHLASTVSDMRRRFAEGRISRRDFEAFLDSTAEGSQLIQRNIERAADLVQSFKQVSVDRSSDGRRSFGLVQFLADLTTSLRPLWRHREVSLVVDCDESLEMDSFPGALGQVLTNLVQNALLHAFDEGMRGEMRVEVRELDAGTIRLGFSDDGRGMPEDAAARAFEPFFTTRRGGGGTGLGLHIVHNLVRAKLGGTVRMETALGKGTRFEFDLPRSAPGGAGGG